MSWERVLGIQRTRHSPVAVTGGSPLRHLLCVVSHVGMANWPPTCSLNTSLTATVYDVIRSLIT